MKFTFFSVSIFFFDVKFAFDASCSWQKIMKSKERNYSTGENFNLWLIWFLWKNFKVGIRIPVIPIKPEKLYDKFDLHIYIDLHMSNFYTCKCKIYRFKYTFHRLKSKIYKLKWKMYTLMCRICRFKCNFLLIKFSAC